MNYTNLEKTINLFALEKRVYIDKNTFYQIFKTTNHVSSLVDHLSSCEQKRVEDITHDQKRNAYILSHALTRILLTLTAKQNLSPNSWLFQHTDKNKPFISGNIYFNISYAKDVCVICISTSYEVGIDISLYSYIENDALPLFLLHENEITLLSKINKKEHYIHFLKMWTYKEAVAKALGLGISLSFNNIDSTLAQTKYSDQFISIFQKDLKIYLKKYRICIAFIKPNLSPK